MPVESDKALLRHVQVANAIEQQFEVRPNLTRAYKDLIYKEETDHRELQSYVVLFFRPTGVSYPPRPDNLLSIEAANVKECDTRFVLEPSKYGKGAGGIEIIAYRRNKLPKTGLSRLTLLVADTWAQDDDDGYEIGTVGWVPKELAPPLRNVIHNHQKRGVLLYKVKLTRGVPTILIGYMIWGLKPYHATLISALYQSYAEFEDRTNLSYWVSTERLYQAWLIQPGYTGKVDHE